MFIIDFSASKEEIQTTLSNRDHTQWTVPVFDFIRSWYADEQIFPVQTSGSTGPPKIIHHSRASMTASAEKTCDFFQLKKNDTALLALPSTHIGGKMMILRSIIRGLRLICTSPASNPLEHFEWNGSIDFAAFTPMQMSIMMDDKYTSAGLSHIQKIILGGGEVSYPLSQRLQSLSSSVYETYGMTETISHIALKKINGAGRSELFTILDGVKISTDERGCLTIYAPHLYSEKITTNDLVKIISDKEFQWLGRYDNIINTGGIKVSAEEIERKLQPYIPANFFVAGVADDLFGQRVSLIVESARPLTLNESLFAEVLNKYEKPRQILYIDRFSYTDNGKLNKRETMKRLNHK